MEDKIDCLLDMIPQESHFYYYFRGRWANGKEGSITDSNGHCVFRFFPLIKDENGNRIDAEIDFDDYDTNPIVATGIIGYWLHFRKNNDRLASYTTWTKEDERKNTLKIFNDYTEDKLKQYIEREQYSPSSWRRDLEKEFYTDFIIPNEEPLNKQSEALFEYITKDDRKLVEEVIEEYMKYLRKCRSDKGYQVNPELLVLRAVESQDNTKYEDLKDYEVNAILSDLKAKGCIDVTWIHGQKQPWVCIMLDKGRAYLKQLEERKDITENSFADSTQRLSTENTGENLNQTPQNHVSLEDTQVIVDEKWDNSLDRIFDEKIIPWEVKIAIKNITSEKIRDRRFYYVGYRILKVIKWIPIETSESDYLRWINLHFNCGWENNKNQKKAFLFNLEGTVKKLEDLHPSEWKDDTLYSTLGKHYRLLALSFKNAFTQTIVKDHAVDNSDSYEHLKDRPKFLKGANQYYGKWFVPDEAYINNGK